MIRTSLTVMPRRGTPIAATGAVFAPVTPATSVTAGFAAVVTGQALSGEPGVLQAVFGGGLLVAASGQLGYGLDAVRRHIAGAVTATISLLFVTFLLVNLLASALQDRLDMLVPFTAGRQVRTLHGHAADGRC